MSPGAPPTLDHLTESCSRLSADHCDAAVKIDALSDDVAIPCGWDRQQRTCRERVDARARLLKGVFEGDDGRVRIRNEFDHQQSDAAIRQRAFDLERNNRMSRRDMLQLFARLNQKKWAAHSEAPIPRTVVPTDARRIAVVRTPHGVTVEHPTARAPPQEGVCSMWVAPHGECKNVDPKFASAYGCARWYQPAVMTVDAYMGGDLSKGYVCQRDERDGTCTLPKVMQRLAQGTNGIHRCSIGSLLQGMAEDSGLSHAQKLMLKQPRDLAQKILQRVGKTRFVDMLMARDHPQTGEPLPLVHMGDHAVSQDSACMMRGAQDRPIFCAYAHALTVMTEFKLPPPVGFYHDLARTHELSQHQQPPFNGGANHRLRLQESQYNMIKNRIDPHRLLPDQEFLNRLPLQEWLTKSPDVCVGRPMDKFRAGQEASARLNLSARTVVNLLCLYALVFPGRYFQLLQTFNHAEPQTIGDRENLQHWEGWAASHAQSMSSANERAMTHA